jgi:hypothetical protein
MPVEIQGQGFVGIAFETTWGTYVPPTKFFPVRNCDLNYTQDTQWRRPIRGLADNIGAVAGFNHVAGDIEMELMENILPYFLYCGRYSIVKSGAINFVYTATPTHWGASTSLPTGKKGLSITVVKSGQIFGFVGCVVTGIELSVDNAAAVVTFSILGKSEASAALPTYTEDAQSLPYGAGQWNIQIPTATQIFDADGLSVNVNDSGEPIHRLSDTVGLQFVKWGERTVTAQMDRDFSTRTEYDAFKILTATSCTVQLTRSINNSVAISLPSAIPETFEPGALSSQGDLVRVSAQYQGVYNVAGSAAATWVVKTQQDII